MKNFARLALVFTICFTAVFMAAALLNFLGLWIEAVKTVPFRQGLSSDFTAAASKALPAALYITVLLSLGYTARHNMPLPLSFIGIFVLASAFILGFTLGIVHLGNAKLAPPAFKILKGGPGIILSRGDTSMILLKGTETPGGPRIAVLPGQPLLYQETPLGPDNAVLSLPSLPFRTGNAWFISSIAIDFDLVSREFEGRLGQGLFWFCLYAGALVFFLSSLRFLLELSRWPLANLVLGAVAFRGILALETFLDTPEIGEFLKSFLGEKLLGPVLTPLVLGILGTLIVLYTVLVNLARSREKNDD
jgi:hypothetical protein